MCDKKNSVLFNDTECIVLSLNFKLIDESQVLLRVPRKNNMYSVDLKNIVPKGGLTCLFAKATSDESKLWHRRLGHLNFKTMNKLVKGNLVRGLPSKLFENDQTCVACQKGKQYRASCKSKTKNSISLPLHLLHMDLFGPTFVKSLKKKMYCLVVTDDYSRFTWVFFLATKDETSGILKSFITRIENLVDHKVKVIRCDNGTEFKNREINQFCEMKAEAVNTTCYMQNRVLVVKPHNKTPYELFHGRTPTLSFMRPFGCSVTILNTIHHLGKFDGKADADWLFDIDALTRIMNYDPIIARTQSNGFAGTKASDNAGQARKETEPVKDYILLPLWTADPPFSQDPKSSHDDRSKPSSDDGKKVDEDPRKDSEYKDQEKEDNNNITNNINIVSSTVNATGGKISIELLFDPNMPSLEDVSIFNFSRDDEDDGAVADMNNLDTTIQVSPNPTTRIHKDHPLNQVIGDLQLATQTRKMSKNLEEHGFVSTIQQRTNHKDLQNCLFACFLSQEEPKRIEAIRLFLAYQMDVKSAFLYKKIEEEVYVCQPSGFKDPNFPDRVYKVEKALYGIHQAPRAWYETLSTYLLDNRFLRGKIDKTLFIKRYKGNILLVQVYVVDIIFSSTKKELCIAFEKLMHEKFQMSSMGELTFFLGLQVKQMKDGIFISQDKYVAKILKKFRFIEVKTASTPMETQKPLLKDEDGEEVDVHLYRSMIDSLMYLTSSRPDIMFAICVCARYQVNPKVSHLYAVKRIFKYLKGQPKLGLWYPKDSLFDLVAYTNSDYARASLDRKSTTGGEGSVNPTDPYHIPTITQPSTSQPNKTQKPRKPKRKDTQIPQSSDPADNVADEVVHKKLSDSLVRAATTASSLEAEKDSGNITKTQFKATPNESSSQGADLGGGPRRVKKLEPKKTSRTHGLKRLRKIGATARVESSDDEERLGEDASKQGRIDVMDADDNITLVSDHHVDVLDGEQEVFVKEVNDEVNVVEEVVEVINIAKLNFDAAQVSAASDKVSTASAATTVSAATTTTTDDLTLAQVLQELKTTKPRVKGIIFREPRESTTTIELQQLQDKSQLQEKGKGIWIEPENPLKKKDQILLDEETALRLQAEFDEEERLVRESAEKEQEAIIALIKHGMKIDADHQLAERLQAQEQKELSVKEKAKLFQQLLETMRNHFAAKRAEEKRNKPPTKDQQRKIMSTYQKHERIQSLTIDVKRVFDLFKRCFNRAFKSAYSDCDCGFLLGLLRAYFELGSKLNAKHTCSTLHMCGMIIPIDLANIVLESGTAIQADVVGAVLFHPIAAGNSLMQKATRGVKQRLQGIRMQRQNVRPLLCQLTGSNKQFAEGAIDATRNASQTIVHICLGCLVQENDTIVEETPMINVDESDSGNDSEPSVVVTKGPKAQSSKRKRNDDKEAQEEEYEIYERTIKERAPIWQHFHPVRVKRDGLRRALCKFCNKTLAAHDANGTSGLHRHYPCPSNPIYVPQNQVQQQTHLEFKKNPSGE
ncbi:putative ribonuclease H-like domain-containing protein, partial [Tanacetum coccineum]